MKFLPKPWHFSSDVWYCGTTIGALEEYTKSNFEVLVTAGYLLENTAGLQWTSNGEYILFKHNEHTPELCSNPKFPLRDPHRAFFAQELFPPSDPPTANPTSASTTPTPTPSPLYQRRILKPRPPHGPPLQPLPSPWTFSSSALYIEATPCSTFLTPLSTLEADVTSGALVVDSFGLRIAHTSTYKLFYTGERNDREKFHTRRITKLEVDRAATLIVDEGGSGGAGVPQSVRFNVRWEGVDAEGKKCEGMMTDNEGKSNEVYRDEGEGKEKGRMMRGGQRGGWGRWRHGVRR
jgi:hypothetical protein